MLPRAVFFTFLLALTSAILPAVLPYQRVQGQSFSAPLADSLSNQAQISLITVLPGDALYSMFGHSAFRVHDSVTGIDETFNYGTFDFSNPVSFALKFAYGQMDYMLSTEPFDRAMLVYSQYENRPVIEQVLNLTPAQRNAVYRFLRINALPENRTYRYDFLFDNCSTRLRDVLEDVLGNQVRFAPEPDPGLSFRRLLDPYILDRRFLDLGFDLLLGLPTDRIATPREATFLPLILMGSFDQARVDSNGVSRPLVAQTDTLYWYPGGGSVERDFPWPGVMFWTLFAVGVVLAVVEYRRGGSSRAGRWFDGILYGAVGLAGVLMWVMWLFTQHTVTSANLNVLWAWPTHFAAAIFILRRKNPGWLRVYLLAAAGVTTVVVAGWWFWPQDLHAAALPICLLLIVRSTARAIRVSQPSAEPSFATGKA
jgi:hypothetical protein